MVLGSLLGLAVFHLLLALHPAIRETRKLNTATAKTRMQREYYARVVHRSGLWGLLYTVVLFGIVFPYSLSDEPKAWWYDVLDCFLILMIYDLIYYLTHRFLFHAKPLMWMHSIHHQQKKPCRKDSSYLHPLESCIGMGLFAATIAVVAYYSGGIGVGTAIITFILFLEINQLNHDVIESDHFPIKYLKYLSDMHHVHHAQFTGGNFATLSLFYDWLFGSYDTGSGWGKNKVTAGRGKAPATE